MPAPHAVRRGASSTSWGLTAVATASPIYALVRVFHHLEIFSFSVFHRILAPAGKSATPGPVPQAAGLFGPSRVAILVSGPFQDVARGAFFDCGDR